MKRLLVVLVLAGCVQTPIYTPQEVKVPVPVPCITQLPPVPLFPLDSAAVSDRYFDKGKAALAEIQVRRAYEEVLTASLRACMTFPVAPAK